MSGLCDRCHDQVSARKCCRHHREGGQKFLCQSETSQEAKTTVYGITRLQKDGPRQWAVRWGFDRPPVGQQADGCAYGGGQLYKRKADAIECFERMLWTERGAL